MNGHNRHDRGSAIRMPHLWTFQPSVSLLADVAIPKPAQPEAPESLFFGSSSPEVWQMIVAGAALSVAFVLLGLIVARKSGLRHAHPVLAACGALLLAGSAWFVYQCCERLAYARALDDWETEMEEWRVRSESRRSQVRQRMYERYRLKPEGPEKSESEPPPLQRERDSATPPQPEPPSQESR
jgi:hypothetical protein